MATGGSRSALRGLVILGLALAGLSIYGKYSLNSDPVELEAAEDRPYATTPLAGPVDSDAITERLMQPLPKLAVRAVDPDGEPLPAATIHADGPLGRTLDAVGEEQWPEIAAGEWHFAAELAGYFPTQETVAVARGDQEELALEMRPAGLVELQSRTSYGKPTSLIAVLLREGESHPRLPVDAEGMLVLDHEGKGLHLSPPLEAGRYTISAGSYGRVLFRSEPRDVKTGERVRAEIVVDRGPLLKVILDGSITLPEGGGNLSLLEPLGERTKRDGTVSNRWKSSERERIRGSIREFEFDRIRPGPYRVELRLGKEGKWESIEPFIVDGKRNQVVVVSRAGSAIAADPEAKARPLVTASTFDDSQFPEAKTPGIRWVD